MCWGWRWAWGVAVENSQTLGVGLARLGAPPLRQEPVQYYEICGAFQHSRGAGAEQVLGQGVESQLPLFGQDPLEVNSAEDHRPREDLY